METPSVLVAFISAVDSFYKEPVKYHLDISPWRTRAVTVHNMIYTNGYVMFWFVVITVYFSVDLCDTFFHVYQAYFTGTQVENVLCKPYIKQNPRAAWNTHRIS